MMVDVKSRKKNDLNHRKKRQCKNCGTATHKKAGLLGKKSIPITIEGKVHQGRCLACKPFQAVSANVTAAAAAAAAPALATATAPDSAPAPAPDPATNTNTNTNNAAAAIAILSPTARKTSQTPQGEPPNIRRNKNNNNNNNSSNNDDNNSDSNSNSSNQIASLLSSSSSSSSSQQQQQQKHSSTAVNLATTTTTTTAITSQPRQRQEQQEQCLETISVMSPRQQRTQLQHHRLDSSNNYGNFDNSNDNNRDARMRSQKQRQINQKSQQRVIHSNIKNDIDIDIEARVSLPLPLPLPLPSSPSATANVGIPRTLEVVHHDRLICDGNISDNDIDSNIVSDDHSVVSAITMDMQLLQAYDDDYIPPQRCRPGPERNNLADGDFDNNNSKNRDNTGDTDHQINHHHRRRRRHHNSSNSNNIHRHSTVPPISEARDTSTPVDGMSSSAAAEEDIVVARQEHNNNKDIRIRDVLTSPDSTATNDVDDNFPSFIIDDYNCNHDRNYTQQQQYQSQQHNSRTIVNTSVSALQRITIPEAPGISSSSSPIMDKDETKEEEEVNNLSDIFQCLNIDECNPDIRVQALTSVGNILRKFSGDKRNFILEHNVTETVIRSMWADMEIVEVQEAAINLLFVITASTVSHSDSNENKDNGCNTMSNMLSNNESICDSILFMMQNHPSVSAIQLKGCLIFASLAATSSDNRKNSDGSLSGAMNMVLNAMSNHVGSRPIRKAGLQALHHQCLLSVHAEVNKKRLIESKLENGMSGIDVIIHAMEELQQDFVAMEWACALSWCVTTSMDLLKHLEDTSLHEHIVSICRHYMTNPVAVYLIEACIGTIANLSYLEGKRNQLINIGAFELIIDGLRHHEDNLSINYEATLALENFALSPHAQDSVGKSEAVPIIVLGLQKFMNSTKYTGEALRALACMATSQLAKKRIGTQGIINIVHQTSRKHDDNADVMEQFSCFTATLAFGSGPITELMIRRGVIDTLLTAMDRFPVERVQDAACLAIRNMLCQSQKSDPFLKRGNTSKSIVSAMEMYRNSVSIQTSACCIFWNMLSKVEEKVLALDPKTVDSIIKAMQSHMESGALLELACGALWAFLDSFDDQKMAVGKEAIDAVTCAMVMHPDSTTTLENACGFLSNLSSEESFAEAIATSQGVNIIAEAMCNNGNSIALMEAGCLTLKNITSSFPSFAQDASVVISTVITAMNDNIEYTSFMKEACNFLWILALEEDNIRSKILALDGISILMKCLEKHKFCFEVQTSALGAFNQLAKPNTQNSR